MASNIRLSEAVEAYLAMRHSKYAAVTVENETFVLRRFVRDQGDRPPRLLRAEHL